MTTKNINSPMIGLGILVSVLLALLVIDVYLPYRQTNTVQADGSEIVLFSGMYRNPVGLTFVVYEAWGYDEVRFIDTAFDIVPVLDEVIVTTPEGERNRIKPTDTDSIAEWDVWENRYYEVRHNYALQRQRAKTATREERDP